MLRVWILALALGGCGGAARPAESPVAAPAAPVIATTSARPRARSLARGDVVSAVDAGLGRFLRRVDVEPSLRDGRFQGFRIVTLRPPEFWQGVDLRPGDVITQVNGQSIETEMEAFAVFESLKSAPALRVSYVRAGRSRELVYPIVGKAPVAPAGAARPSAKNP
jgi:hypothetical protein